MTVKFKDWNLDLGHAIVTLFFLSLIIAVMHIVVSPILVTILPMVFTSALSLTDVLLFLILTTLYIRK